jgi:hypothetical protein
MIFANDNLVGGTVVAALPLTTAVVRDDDACLGANSLTCRLVAFDLFLSTSITVGRRVAEAYNCAGGNGRSSEATSANCVGGGINVGWFVSMTIRSGGCCIEAIRMTGLLFSFAVPSGNDCGTNQFVTSNTISSDAPTQPMYRPIGINVSAHLPDESKRRNS